MQGESISPHKTAQDALSQLGVDSKEGLTQAQVEDRLKRYGANALAEQHETLLQRVLPFFWAPIPWMIEAAALLALVLQDWGDFAIITGLLVFNAALGLWEEYQAKNALDALQNSLALKARALRDGVWSEIQATNLVPGDIVRLRLGDVVPADCTLLSGDYVSVDQAALTGESLPVTKKVDDGAYAGSVVKMGEMDGVVTSTGEHTFFGRTAKLVGDAGATSHFQKAVLRIGDFLIVLALVLAVILVADQLYAMRANLDRESLLRLAEFVLILLVASVPVAMPAVLSVTMALGAQMLARKKAVVSRLQSIEELAGMNILCSDKTGTLTQNKLTLGDVQTWGLVQSGDVVLAGALASRMEDEDPIDLAILAGLRDRAEFKNCEQTKFVPFDPVSKRSEATVKDGADGTFQVSKGAPQVILDLAKVSGEDRKRLEATIDDLAGKGFRTLGVARAEKQGEWTFLGLLPLFDPPRTDSKETIERARSYGVDVKMVTGDNVAIAREVSSQLGMGRNIELASSLFSAAPGGGVASPKMIEAIEHVDGFAEVFPEHKYAIVKALQQDGHITGMTGDGVNDAPALKQSDVGIAVSGATEAARAAAAVVLTAPGLSVIIDGIEEARRIFARMMSYTLYRIAMTIDIMVFVVLSSIYYDFFPLTPIMIVALALLDDVPIMAIAFDKAEVSSRPVRWQMDRVLLVSSMLGLLAVVQSFALLYIGDTVWHLSKPELQTMMFLQLVAGGHLMLFLTRNRRGFWNEPYPSAILLLAILGTQLLAVVVTGFGVLVEPISWILIGWVWVYNLFWMVAQDLIKVCLYKALERRSTNQTHFQAKLWKPLVPWAVLHRRKHAPRL